MERKGEKFRRAVAKFAKKLKERWGKITLEPVIFLFRMSYSSVYDSGIKESFLMRKVCHYELGHNVSSCSRLSGALLDQVQVQAAEFDAGQDLATFLPGILCALFAGALSDRFGRKPLLYWPMIGMSISSVFMLIHLKCLNTFPMEYLHLDNFYHYFGGSPLYYMGVYSFGIDVTTEKERAYRLARFDGTEMLAQIIGKFLSPRIHKWGGYESVLTVHAVLNILSLLYLTFVIQESCAKKPEDEGQKEEDVRFYKKYVLVPFREFATTVTRRREGGGRIYVHLLLVSYTAYWFVLPYKELLFLYYVKTVPGFTLVDFGDLNTFDEAVGAVVLLTVVPLLLVTLGLDETTATLAVNASVAAGLVASATLTSRAASLFPDVYLCRLAVAPDIAQYPLGRSLMSKLVGEDEVGKISAALAVAVGVAYVAASPVFKRVYSTTLPTYPGAFLLAVAGVYVLPTALNFVLWVKRYEISRKRTSSVAGATAEIARAVSQVSTASKASSAAASEGGDEEGVRKRSI